MKLYVLEILTREPDGYGLVASCIADEATLGPRVTAIAAIARNVGVTVSQSPREVPVPAEPDFACFLHELTRVIARRNRRQPAQHEERVTH